MSESARGHFEAGKLQDAIQAMNAEVRAKPGDLDRRGFLTELLCFEGSLERADKMLDLMGTQDPAAALGLSLFRQQIRAEMARREFFGDGRVPEFLGDPPDHLKLHLEASVAIREGDIATGAKLLADAEEQRPKVSGTCNGEAFDDIRDLDDLTAGFFEVLTSTGKYYWIPTERVATVEMHRPERPRDLIWRRASMDVNEGPDGEVYLPAIYVTPGVEVDERTQLGRVTDFIGGEGEPVRGVGQRTFLVGDEAMPILEIQSLEFGG